MGRVQDGIKKTVRVDKRKEAEERKETEKLELQRLKGEYKRIWEFEATQHLDKELEKWIDAKLKAAMGAHESHAETRLLAEAKALNDVRSYLQNMGGVSD